MGRKKQKKRLKKLMKALRDGASSAGEPTMNSDPFPPAPNADPSSGTATIPPVTEAMMDHAAHRAAELVEGAAHGALAAADPAPQALDTAAPADTEMAAFGAEPPSDAALEPVSTGLARDAVVPATEADDESATPAVPSGGEVAAAARDAVARTTQASEAALSGSAAALGRYNAKLFEAMRANMAASGSHMAALVQAKSVPEAMALNADHLRRQLDAMTAQGRELATLAQRLTLEALGPLRGLIPPSR